eukprot:11175035-Lingulodinium_polyedra.AAC.1
MCGRASVFVFRRDGNIPGCRAGPVSQSRHCGLRARGYARQPARVLASVVMRSGCFLASRAVEGGAQ